ncbi:MAG: K(+)-transporting ATPase subunit F [Xanthomonadaceae bacterium]|jgi:K+-transporting ATPase KdpF subunit|nr:K(+)-transporting ATPase subunit F [Xanthomonadaceae bacterium]
MAAEPGWVYALAGILSAGLFGYLLYALINPEDLE